MQLYPISIFAACIWLLNLCFPVEFNEINCLDAAFDSKCYQEKGSALQMSYYFSIMNNTTLDFAREYDKLLLLKN